MKYLDRYIKTLDKEVEVSDNNGKSSTKYYNINGFDIRLSDHRSPIEHLAKPKQLDIIQLYQNEMFIVYYRDTNKPMLKNRKEVKTFIKNALDMFCLTHDKNESEKQWDEAKKKEKVNKLISKATTNIYNNNSEPPKHMDWKPERYKVESIIQKHPDALNRRLESTKVFTYVGCLKSYKGLKKDSRRLFMELYNNTDLIAADIIRAVADNNGENDANNISSCVQKYIALNEENKKK